MEAGKDTDLTENRSRSCQRFRCAYCTAFLLIVFLAFGCSSSQQQSAIAAGTDAGNLTVSPAKLTAYLQAEFARLGINPAKVPQAAPSGNGNAVFDLQGEVTFGTPSNIVLSWTERSLGDYNQDGLVSINDLTPVGQRYYESVAHDDPADHDGLDYWPTGDPDDAGAENWRLARIDGNDDGLIYLTDITTIAQHWNERLDGYRLYFKEPGAAEFGMYPNPDDAGAPLTVVRSAVAPAEANSPYRYFVAFELTVFEGEFQFYVAPYDAVDDQVGTPSPILTLALPQGQPPAAALTADVTAGNPPLNVHFDASASSDPEGAIVGFSWDFDGDGTYDEHSTEPTATHSYPTGGVFPATVRVEDAEQQLDTASLDITVNQAPTAVLSITPLEPTVVPFTVSYSAGESSDPDGTIVQYDYDWGSDGDFELIDAGPEPSPNYILTLPGDYPITVRVTDNQGRTDTDSGSAVGLYGEWHSQTIATENVGQDCSLALVDGYPAISYHDGGKMCLGYVRATDEFGSENWGAPVKVTGDFGDEGGHTSLAVIDGHPAIAFDDSYDQTTCFTRSSDAQGAAWPLHPVVVRGERSWFISLIEADGRPAIAYMDNGSIYYQRADDADGTTWLGSPKNVENITDNCSEPSMAVVNGNPAIAYKQMIDGLWHLVYVAASQPSGMANWLEPVIADSRVPFDTGARPDLAQIGTNPAISYGGVVALPDDQRPFYLRSSSQGADGSWDDPGPQELSAAMSVNVSYTSVAGVGFYPHAVFYDSDTGTLWHVWARDFTGNNWMDPVIVDDGGGTNYAGSYCDLKNINGRPAVAYYDSTAFALKYAVLR